MKKSTVFLYWVLLIVPAIIIGAVGFWLLSNEQERWERMERTTALERARAIAQTMRNTVEGVEREITDGWLAIPRESLLDTLLMWDKENPLIRNVFIWQPKLGLQYPSSADHASPEQMRFVNRYQTLFIGRTAWLPDDPKALSDLSGSTRNVSKPSKGPSIPAQTYERMLMQRAKSSLSDQQAAQSRPAEPQITYGWIPWFSDNRLHLLGWVQGDSSDVVYGAELETVILVSRLMDQFPKEENDGIVYGLIDDAGRLLHQLGRADVQSNLVPALEVSLTPHLPHWRVAVYFDHKAASARSGNAFLIITGLLLATLIVAILLGGALLTHQAYSSVAGRATEKLVCFERLSRAQDATDNDSHVCGTSPSGHRIGPPKEEALSQRHRLRVGAIDEIGEQRAGIQPPGGGTHEIPHPGRGCGRIHALFSGHQRNESPGVRNVA